MDLYTLKENIDSQIGLFNDFFGISAQSLDKSRHLKVGLEYARDLELLLSAYQPERSFQSEFSKFIIFTFHLNEEHVFFNQ